MVDFNRELCIKTHEECERRITVLEIELKASATRQESLLSLIHDRFNEITMNMQARLPIWATLLLGGLMASTTGLLVAALK